MRAPAWLRLLRPHQWSKNLLIVVPAAAAHRTPDAAMLGALALAFVLLSATASALYAVNDVVDVEHDRVHPTKGSRPVAAGELSSASALIAGAFLVVFAGAGTLALMPRDFQLALGTYAVASMAYSGGLKRLVVLDVVVLATLYTVRVVAGAAAVAVPLSRWFLAFSVFMFLSLALLKRAAEAKGAPGAETAGAVLHGRGWRREDMPVLVAFGAGCAVAAALVYCLYITGEDVSTLYGRPDVLWLGLPVLLYWISRAWLLALRGEVRDDPVLFALRDPASHASALALVLVVWLAS